MRRRLLDYARGAFLVSLVAVMAAASSGVFYGAGETGQASTALPALLQTANAQAVPDTGLEVAHHEPFHPDNGDGDNASEDNEDNGDGDNEDNGDGDNSDTGGDNGDGDNGDADDGDNSDDDNEDEDNGDGDNSDNGDGDNDNEDNCDCGDTGVDPLS